MGTTTSNVPLTLISDIYPLDSGQLTTFRTVWIRDQVSAGVGLSAYNKATGSQFFSDNDINAILNNVLVDKQESLVQLYLERYNERVINGDDDTTAKATAATEQLNAIYRLMRADCFERMAADPSFQGSVAEGASRSFFDEMNRTIARDRSWTRSRSGGFATIPVVRF